MGYSFTTCIISGLFYYTSWLLIFSLDPACGQPQENPQEDRVAQFKSILYSQAFEGGRVWLEQEEAYSNNCKFVGWKNIDVIFAYKNTARDLVVMVETSAGAIICTTTQDLMEDPIEKWAFWGLKEAHLLPIYHQLEPAINAAWKYLQKDLPIFGGCDSPMKIYGVEIWTPYKVEIDDFGHEDRSAKFPDSTRLAIGWLNEWLGKKNFGEQIPLLAYYFPDEPNNGLEVVCAIWQRRPGVVTLKGSLGTRVSVYFGNDLSSNSQGGMGETVDLALSEGESITEKHLLRYHELAYYSGKITSYRSPSFPYLSQLPPP